MAALSSGASGVPSGVRHRTGARDGDAAERDELGRAEQRDARRATVLGKGREGGDGAGIRVAGLRHHKGAQRACGFVDETAARGEPDSARGQDAVPFHIKPLAGSSARASAELLRPESGDRRSLEAVPRRGRRCRADWSR